MRIEARTTLRWPPPRVCSATPSRLARRRAATPAAPAMGRAHQWARQLLRLLGGPLLFNGASRTRACAWTCRTTLPVTATRLHDGIATGVPPLRDVGWMPRRLLLHRRHWRPRWSPCQRLSRVVVSRSRRSFPAVIRDPANCDLGGASPLNRELRPSNRPNWGHAAEAHWGHAFGRSVPLHFTVTA